MNWITEGRARHFATRLTSVPSRSWKMPPHRDKQTVFHDSESNKIIAKQCSVPPGCRSQ